MHAEDHGAALGVHADGLSQKTGEHEQEGWGEGFNGNAMQMLGTAFDF